MTAGPDPFDLERFVTAQAQDFERALGELRAGRKRSHWMWYVFPQLRGLGMSHVSQLYGISGIPEARAYLAHPVLGPRLLETVAVLLATEDLSAHDIFGSPDDLKLRSSATLFAQAAGKGSPFDRLLEKFFDGEPDPVTLERLNVASS